MKKITVWTALLIAVLLCLATFMTTYALLGTKTVPESQTPVENSSQESNPRYSEFVTKLADKMSAVDSIYRELYIGELDDDTLIDYAVAGYVGGTGDTFGNYFTVDGFEEFTSDTTGQVAGVGVQVIYNSDYNLIEVLSVVKDPPADLGGVLPGDLVYSVGEGDAREFVSDLGYYGAIDKIRGEIGTEVTFSVLRGNNYSEEVICCSCSKF